MKTKKLDKSAAERKARQRAKMREWILKQTGGKITTADGYVQMLMRKQND